ncbi:hypothetical protein HOF56_04215 [Candidatus Peribacteria bacterium]|jgi:hypothetical protein|nr:hypothetical protein [Candidatus Peribacteria bacterium]MBT4021695.1 hypothetical protein [Candidatus Peribacteria bacterium]MBT4240279.1 hypothetical protein [Candidatus Peribacteria bacterium]MBT4473894.1 hypothetical protein [Candidatus Peribacteria bacterium]
MSANPELAEALAVEDELDAIDPALIDAEFDIPLCTDPRRDLIKNLDSMNRSQLLALAYSFKDVINDLDDIATKEELYELRERLKKIIAMGNGTLN